MRPLTFWIFVAAMIFVAMTLLWGLGDEPTGATFVISAVLYWGSGIALIFFGLVLISRRLPSGRNRPERSTDTRPDRPSRV